MKQSVYENETTAVTGGKKSYESGGDQAEMMKKAEAAARPGPAHKALDALVGNWKAEVKCWADPGGAPEVSQGMAESKWILEGHFLQQDFHGEMMGRPFHGRSLMGFDNTRQVFNSIWVSDMQTSMFTTEGKGDNGYKTLTLEGTASCPATGRTDIPMKTVFRLLSPDKFLFEMFDGSKGANAKTMEITYTRR